MNKGTNAAERVRVSFGFYPFTAGIPNFYDIGSKIIDVPGSPDPARPSVVEASIDWMPPPLPPLGTQMHGCILVTIDYGYDKVFSNKSNFAQKNVVVEIAKPEATFHFRVENPLPTKATIRLRVENKLKNWDIGLSDREFVMETYDCARVVDARVTPSSDMRPEAEALYFVTALAAPWGTADFVEVGGVALRTRHEP